VEARKERKEVMVNLKFGFNFEFVRDKSKDKIYDETKIVWKPEVKDGSGSVLAKPLGGTGS
jgi:hypothetical protein